MTPTNEQYVVQAYITSTKEFMSLSNFLNYKRLLFMLQFILYEIIIIIYNQTIT